MDIKQEQDIDLKLKLMLEKEIEIDIGEIHSNIFEKTARYNQLTEELFAKYFVPFFTGKVKDNRDLNLTTYWIGIAGSPTNPVEIVDNKGTVLFIVPPLVSTDFLHDAKNRTGKSFSDVAQEASDKAQRIPMLAQTVLAKKGVTKLLSMTHDDNKAGRDSWQAILRRYDADYKGDMEDSSKEIKTINTQNDDLCFD